MPIFEFRCLACGHEFEELVRAAASGRNPECPQCGAPRSERRLSVFAARGAPASERPAANVGGCARCGDPGGPCG